MRLLLALVLLAISRDALAQPGIPSFLSSPSRTDHPAAIRAVAPEPAAEPRRTRQADVSGLQALAALRPQATRDDQPDLLLNLFADAAWPAIIERVDHDALGHTSWSGRLDGVPLSSFSLTVSARAMSGAVHAGTARYTLTGRPDVVTVRELTTEEQGVELLPLSPPADAAMPRAPWHATREPAIGDDAASVADVLLLYTPDARASAGSQPAIEATLAQAMAEANLALHRSGVAGRFRTVGMMEVPYTQSASGLLSDLTALASAPAASSLREATGADLVALIVDRVSGGACGIGYIGPSPAYAFSVTARPCLGQHTLAHELAHNLGSDHAPGDSMPQGWRSYSYGYKDPALPTPFRTVMAYPCAGTSCPRVLQFSNPTVAYAQTGRLTGTDGQNNATSLTEAFPVVAAFRASRLDIPEAPSGLRATLQGEVVTLTWLGVTGATSYRLEAGTSPRAKDLFDGELGVATSVTGRLSPGRYFARVRAVRGGLTSPASADLLFEIARDVATPAAPSALRAVITGGRVTLSWDPPAGGASRYILEAGSAPGRSDRASTQVEGAVFTADGVPPGEYYVRVRALGSGGPGPSSDELRVVVTGR